MCTPGPQCSKASGCSSPSTRAARWQPALGHRAPTAHTEVGLSLPLLACTTGARGRPSLQGRVWLFSSSQARHSHRSRARRCPGLTSRACGTAGNRGWRRCCSSPRRAPAATSAPSSAWRATAGQGPAAAPGTGTGLRAHGGLRAPCPGAGRTAGLGRGAGTVSRRARVRHGADEAGEARRALLPERQRQLHVVLGAHAAGGDPAGGRAAGGP